MIRLLLALLVAAGLASPAAAQTAAKPKVAAFIVGIEHYTKRTQLNNLKSVARDARDLFVQLGAVSELHETSRLLLAQKKESESEPDLNKQTLEKPEWKAEEIRRELRKFVRAAPEGHTILVYFGGHGIVSGNHLLVAGSDYIHNQVDHDGYNQYEEVYSTIDQALREKGRPDQPVVMLINTCHAGAADGSMDASSDGAALDKVMEEQRLELEAQRRELEARGKTLADRTKGLLKFAMIPAVAGDEQAFERKIGARDEVRGEFAYHLIEGLKQPSGEDGITTGQLFAYVNAKLGSKLPRNPDFEDKIQLGRTNDLDAAARYLLGLSHLSVWLDFDDSAHHDLASAHLEKAIQIGGAGSSTTALAQLRWSQAKAAAGAPPGAWSGTLDILFADKADAALPAGEREAALRLQTAANPSAKFPTLSALRDYLERGEPFYGLVITMADGRVGRAGDARSDGLPSLWSTVLRGYAGHKAIEMMVADPVPRPIVEQVKRFTSDWAPGADGVPLLLVNEVSAGVTPEGRLFPLGAEDVAEVAKAWPGPLVAVHLGPFGGYLWNARLPENVALLTASVEPNGMTFATAAQRVPSGREELLGYLRGRPAGGLDTEGLMALGLLDGGEPGQWPWLGEYKRRYDRFLSSMRRQPGSGNSRKQQDWIVGTPGWRAGVDPRTLAREQLEPLKRLGLLFAKGCANGDLLDCERSLAKGPQDAGPPPPSPLAGLIVAAEADLAGQRNEAVAGYNAFLASTKALRVELPPAPDPATTARDEAAKVLDRQAVQVQELLDRLASSAAGAHKVRFVPIAIEDYESPLVPDLPGARDDAEHWARLLARTVEGVERRCFATEDEGKCLDKPPRTADELEAHLEKVLGEANEGDVTLLYFSGRGQTDDSGYALALAGWKPPTDSPEGTEAKSHLSLKRIAELAEAHKGWLLALYDAQFERPVFGPDRPDSVLDKHVHATRPLAPALASRAEADRLWFPSDEPGQTSLSRQVHIWFEGRLTQATTPQSRCFNETLDAGERFHSPLSVTLAQALRLGTTYREVAKDAVESCLPKTTPAGEPLPLNLVVQGEVDVPVLGAGAGVERVVVLRDDHPRRELNLHAALALADDTRSRSANPQAGRAADPLVELSAAAFRVVLADRQAELPVALQASETRDWLENARTTLLGHERTSPDDFANVRLDLLTRALELLGGSSADDARDRLAKQLLRVPALPGTIERLDRLTRRAVRAQSGPLLRALEGVLRSACVGDEAARLGPTCDDWQIRLAAQRQGLRERYRIELGSASAP
jgi:hypothetical protein